MTDKAHKAGGRIILAIDTSSKITSIAVARDAVVLDSIVAAVDQTRSEKLWLEVESLLAKEGISVRDADLFAVCTGPGGFTGLRVGIAAVKGFASATKKPIVGITSLEAAAYSVRPAVVVCALLNAYKGEVYSQMFSFDGDGAPMAENAPAVSSIESALDRAAEWPELLFAGDGVEAHAEAIALRGEHNWSIKRSDRGMAEDIAALAFMKSEREEFDVSASLKACYVRPAEAEIKLSLGLLGSKIRRNMKSE